MTETGLKILNTALGRAPFGESFDDGTKGGVYKCLGRRESLPSSKNKHESAFKLYSNPTNSSFYNVA